MLKKEQVNEIIKIAKKYLKGLEWEIGIDSTNTGTTRFANSIIHQNMGVHRPFMWVRIINKNRIGSSTTTDLSEEGIKNLIERAINLSKSKYAPKLETSLPKKTKIEKVSKKIVISPKEREEAVAKIVEVCKKNNLNAFGVIHTINSSLAIFNSNGVNNYALLNWTYTTITAMNESASGFSFAIEKDFYKIDFKKLANIACEKALMAKNPKDIEPGKYTVFLEEPAVAEIISFLAWLEFGAKRFYEKTSLISKKIGKKITGKNITIYDDWTDKLTLGIPFDFEGVKRNKVILIKNGIAKSVVTDSYFAKKLKMKNTGHSLMQPAPWGPFPLNLVFEKGDKKKEEMLKSIDKGIYVTRFWYTRVVDPDRTLITGMTRDGTYFIEKGKIAYPIKNMRFLINIYETLENVKMISKEQKYYGEELFGVVAPALVIENFNFQSKTEY
ncbi:MAG: TldD/PmbA family protein [candidate division WOR-3 bacterium]